MSTDEEFMLHALQLAKRGFGHVAPNPAVGAVIVANNGRVIGEGWHERFGGLHAERNAFAHCTDDTTGATLYVTLEPCCHWGKTPPCTDIIIEKKIGRVVVGSMDPNPLVAGKGVQLLREAGIEVVTGVCKQACDDVNRPFFHFITHKRPYVILKYAMTLDGKIATRTGASKWITGEEARFRVHQDRNRYSAVCVGVGTVRADDPRLTCRIEGGTNPLRVIVDSHLSTPLDSTLVRTAADVPTLIATCKASEEARAPFVAAGVEVARLPGADGRVDIDALLDYLGAKGIDSMIVEGGATLAASFLEGGFVDEVNAYIAPKIFGGEGAKGPVAGQGVSDPGQAYRFGAPFIVQLGSDVMLRAYADRGAEGGDN